MPTTYRLKVWAPLILLFAVTGLAGVGLRSDPASKSLPSMESQSVATLPPTPSMALRSAPQQRTTIQLAAAAVDLSEPEITRAIAQRFGWDAEVQTSVGTRCDLVSDRLAMEVEWPKASKPYEAVGQALHYSVELGREPAICFLVSGLETSSREYALARVGKVCRLHGIEVYWFDYNSRTLSKEQWNAK